MYQKMSWLKKVSLMLGVATLMLGVLPVASLPGFAAFADDSPVELPAEEPVVEEPVFKESKSEEPVGEQPVQDDGQEDQSGEDQGQEGLDDSELDILFEEEFSLSLAATPKGETDKTPEELGVVIGPGGSACDQSANCEKEETNVSNGGNFMPSDDFKYPTAVVIKTGGQGNQYFIYSPDGSFDCDFQVGKDPYCVAFEDDGSITVTLNPCYALVGAQNKCQPAKDISHIQIWKNGQDVDECECGELGVAAVVNGDCVCDDPDDPDDPDNPGDPGDPNDPDTPVTSSGTPGVSASVPVSAPLAGEEAVVIPVTGADQLASLQELLRSIGVAFMGVSFLSAGIQKKMKY